MIDNLVDIQESLDECGFTIEATRRMLEVAESDPVDREDILRDCMSNLRYARKDIELARQGLNQGTILH